MPDWRLVISFTADEEGARQAGDIARTLLEPVYGDIGTMTLRRDMVKVVYVAASGPGATIERQP